MGKRSDLFDGGGEGVGRSLHRGRCLVGVHQLGDGRDAVHCEVSRHLEPEGGEKVKGRLG